MYIGDYLARRGYGYDVVVPVVERVWKELGAADSSGADDASGEDDLDQQA